MTYSVEDLAKWLLLSTRVMADMVPPHADSVYLVGEAEDNALSVISRGAELWRKGKAPMVAIQKGAEKNGYYGYENYARGLFTRGVPRNKIVPVQLLPEFEAAGQIIHTTLTELISLAQFCKKEGWEKVILVASALHQLRSFISMVTAIDHEYPELKVYSCVGTYLPWSEDVKHSQGTTIGIRSDLVIGEIERILRYQKTGTPYPLVSVERAFRYLDKRDAA